MSSDSPLINKDAIIDALYLVNMSPDHRNTSVDTFSRYFINPILAGNYLLQRHNDMPVGLFTWAWLTPHEGELLIAGELNLSPEMCSRDQAPEYDLWGLDLIAPTGHAKDFIRFCFNYGRDRYGKFDVRWRRFKNPTKKHLRRINHGW